MAIGNLLGLELAALAKCRMLIAPLVLSGLSLIYYVARMACQSELCTLFSPHPKHAAAGSPLDSFLAFALMATSLCDTEPQQLCSGEIWSPDLFAIP